MQTFKKIEKKMSLSIMNRINLYFIVNDGHMLWHLCIGQMLRAVAPTLISRVLIVPKMLFD